MGVNITPAPTTTRACFRPDRRAESRTQHRQPAAQPVQHDGRRVLDTGRQSIVKIETLRDDLYAFYAFDAEAPLRAGLSRRVRGYAELPRRDQGDAWALAHQGRVADRRLDGKSLAYGAASGRAGTGLRPSSRFGTGRSTATTPPRFVHSRNRLAMARHLSNGANTQREPTWLIPDRHLAYRPLQ